MAGTGRAVDLLRDYLASHSDDIAKLAQNVGLRVADVAKQAWLLVVVPLLSIFFLKDGRAFSEILLDLVQSRPQRELLAGRAQRLEPDAGSFHPRATHPGGADLRHVLGGSRHDEGALCAGAGNGGRVAGIYSGAGPLVAA